MRNVKEYDLAYMTAIENMEIRPSKRRVNKYIAKKWGVTYEEVKALCLESEKIFNEHWDKK